uniref:GPI ethanolamine phosphate transferase 1 n=1 Tax=Panagrolaimus superbus TaxID=310955 RepID=A0A914YIP1_9BILA
MHFFILGLFVHLVLFYSIFDIYYTSPLVKGTNPHPITKGAAIAKRVVVFSADGLRSTAFFANPEKSPFLHDIIRNGKGVWGISKSHVPTESRPGHVAMLAGFYEDVSAVTLGWKHNPVKFDSVFNQSRFSYMWGSPDILPMFSHELKHTRVEMYTHEEEDFASADAASLDRWVFEKVTAFFANAAENSEISTQLFEDRQIFFMHLLGLDTNGHGSKPFSRKYVDNIATVDLGIQQVSKLFYEFFGDNSTAFVFTADHGMTDWGSHGSGTDDEILTPLVAWGSGIQGTVVKQIINQVDIAPFISSLIGIAVPMNSVGVLPLNMLKASPQFKYQAACGNLKQMVEQYNIRRTERETNALPFLFKDFYGFKATVLNKVQEQISELKNQRRLDQAASFCLDWIPRVRDALIYFHRYQRTSLGIAIALMFITWNCLLYSIFARSATLPPLERSTLYPNKPTCIVAVIVFLLITYQRLPFTNYLYYLLPIYLIGLCFNVWSTSPRQWFIVVKSVDWIQAMSVTVLKSFLIQWIGIAAIFGFSLCIFVSAFFQRSILSLMLTFLSIVPSLQGNKLYPWNILWFGTCFVLSIFPQLETVGKTPIPFLVIGTSLFAPILLHFAQRQFKLETSFSLKFLKVCLGFSFILQIISYACNTVPLSVKLCCWLSFPVGFTIPFFATQNLSERIISWLMALFLPYSLLSLAYESLFVLLFAVLLFTYVRLEFSHLSDEQFFQLEVHSKAAPSTQAFEVHGPFNVREWKRALILVCLVEIAFFGTGNIASLNSFNPTFLRNFITVFSPFTMAALLIFKISIPFLLLGLAFAAILYLEHRILVRLSVLLMILTDSMAMIFFFYLRDEGSWLEIGISISNFVISMASSGIVFLLLHLANFLLPITVDDLKNRFKIESNVNV